MFAYLIVISRQEAHRNSSRIDVVCTSFASVGNLDVIETTTKNGAAFIIKHRNAAIKLGCGDELDHPTNMLLRKALEYDLDMDG